MNPAIRRRLPWALAALVGLSALGLLMSDPAAYFLGILGGFAVVLLIGVLTGAFRAAPKV